jgi:hypothetical protein
VTLRVYRFRRELPLGQNTLDTLAGLGASVQAYSPGEVFDVQIDDSKATDLEDTLKSNGFELNATDPTSVALSATDVIKFTRTSGTPTVDQDETEGYGPGSLWVGTSASPERVFCCLDATVGAAVWSEILSGGLADVFRAQQIETDNLDSTSLTTPQNAFAGEPLEYVTISADGDYLVFFEADTEMTNSNGIGEISVGKNGLTILTGSERQLAGNQRRSTITIKRANSLVIGDTIYALFRQVSGSGQMNIRGRSLSLFRIAT